MTFFLAGLAMEVSNRCVVHLPNPPVIPSCLLAPKTVLGRLLDLILHTYIFAFLGDHRFPIRGDLFQAQEILLHAAHSDS